MPHRATTVNTGLVLSSHSAAPLALALCNQQNNKESTNSTAHASASASSTRWRTMALPAAAVTTVAHHRDAVAGPLSAGSSAAMTLSNEQRTALSHACALILLYSPSSRASFESLDSLLEAVRSCSGASTASVSSSASIPLQLVSLGIEGEMPVVSTAEGAAWAARVSTTQGQGQGQGSSTAHPLAISFSAVVICKAQWDEWTAAQKAQEAALAAEQEAERQANTRWWRRLCRARRSHSSSSPSSAASSPAPSPSCSPLWVAPSPSLPGEIRAIEDPTPVLPEEAAAAAASSAAIAAAPSPASFLELQQLQQTSEADILLAAAAASSRFHPLPSPTSVEVEELMSSSGVAPPAAPSLSSDTLQLLLDTDPADSEAASLVASYPLRSPPGPRAISATLHVDASSILSPAATKVMHPHGYSSPSGNLLLSGPSSSSHSNASTRKTSPISHNHRHQHQPSTSSLCSTASTTPVLRSRNNSHACNNTIANTNGANNTNAFSFFTPCYDSCSCSSCHAATLATAAAAAASAASAASAAAAASAAVVTLPSKASAARPVAGERVKKLMCRAWSDGDAERLAAILPITASECAAAAAANAAANTETVQQQHQPIVSPVQVSPSPSTTVIAPVSFKHHPTQSPFARYADVSPHVVSPLLSSSSAASSSSAEAHTHPNSLPSTHPVLSSSTSSSSRSLPALVAPHSSFSCTCRGTLSFLFDHAAGATNGNNNSNGNMNKQWPTSSESNNTYTDPAVYSPPPPLAAARYSPLSSHSKVRVNLGLFAAMLVLVLVLLFARSLLLLHDPDAHQLTTPTMSHTPQLAISVLSQALPNHDLIT